MEFLIVDMTPPLRAALSGRVQESVRQAGAEQFSVAESDPLNLDSVEWDKVVGCFIGSGCGGVIKELLAKIHSLRADCPIALVLDQDTYSSEAVAIHKLVGHAVIAETDLTQMATFVLECERRAAGRPAGARERRVFGVVHFSGGVGASTVCAALGSVLVGRGLSTVLLDFDEVTCDLTEWAAVPAGNRAVVGECIKTGGVTAERIRDAVYRLDNFERRLGVMPQPTTFQEGLQLKAAVLAGAPSPVDYVQQLYPALLSDFDIVLVDCSRSWGIANLATLPWCQKVLMVVGDSQPLLTRSLGALTRFREESGDSDEFNLAKWILVVNRFTNKNMRAKEIGELAADALFGSENLPLYIPASSRRLVVGPEPETLYEQGDAAVKKALDAMVNVLVPR